MWCDSKMITFAHQKKKNKISNFHFLRYMFAQQIGRAEIQSFRRKYSAMCEK